MLVSQGLSLTRKSWFLQALGKYENGYWNSQVAQSTLFQTRNGFPFCKELFCFVDVNTNDEYTLATFSVPSVRKLT